MGASGPEAWIFSNDNRNDYFHNDFPGKFFFKSALFDITNQTTYAEILLNGSKSLSELLALLFSVS